MSTPNTQKTLPKTCIGRSDQYILAISNFPLSLPLINFSRQAFECTQHFHTLSQGDQYIKMYLMTKLHLTTVTSYSFFLRLTHGRTPAVSQETIHFLHELISWFINKGIHCFLNEKTQGSQVPFLSPIAKLHQKRGSLLPTHSVQRPDDHEYSRNTDWRLSSSY